MKAENNKDDLIKYLTDALNSAVKEAQCEKLRADQTHKDLLDFHNQLIIVEMYADSERVSDFAGRLAAKGPEIRKYL
ncbi:uncharacterized protein METZ01_LOCUS178310 [marine metagenome]|uniref:Uncharacterized protein n=1 Tax=marine metagenome TaxID=408172 RepID=A0A382CH68_9ZZZZ